MPTKLPEAVQRQLEDAERIDAEIAGPAPADPPPEPSPPPEEPAPETPPAEPPPAAPPAEENWQHKYLSLQGKYNTEIAALRAEVANLTQQLQAPAAQPASTPESTQPPAAEPPKLVTQADVDAFGADLVDLMRRIAVETDGGEKQKLQAEIDRLKAMIPTLQKGVEQATETAEASRRVDYFSDLRKLCPDYEAVNVDEAFLGWLTAPDPLSGIKRDDILQDAFAKFDHARTAALFNAFVKETGWKAPQSAAIPATPAPPPRETLEAQVSPSGSRTPAPPAANGQTKTWTTDEIHQFYVGLTRGDYRGRETEARRIEAEIDQALIAGRVQG